MGQTVRGGWGRWRRKIKRRNTKEKEGKKGNTEEEEEKKKKRRKTTRRKVGWGDNLQTQLKFQFRYSNFKTTSETKPTWRSQYYWQAFRFSQGSFKWLFFGCLHCVTKVCSDISEKHTASFFMGNSLVQLNAEVLVRNLLSIQEGSE